MKKLTLLPDKRILLHKVKGKSLAYTSIAFKNYLC